MPTEHAAPSRDYEEALRSLGQLFDEQRLEDVLLVERGSGFFVTGLRRAGAPGLGEEPRHRYDFVESEYADEEVVAASMEGAKRRGTNHRADRNEEGLRLIGRHVNERGGSRLLAVDQGEGFIVRMLVEAEQDMPHHFDSVTSSQLEQMREIAVGSRRDLSARQG